MAASSPFLATANGQLYYDVVTPDRGKWSYQMQASIEKYTREEKKLLKEMINKNC